VFATAISTLAFCATSNDLLQLTGSTKPHRCRTPTNKVKNIDRWHASACPGIIVRIIIIIVIIIIIIIDIF